MLRVAFHSGFPCLLANSDHNIINLIGNPLLRRQCRGVGEQGRRHRLGIPGARRFSRLGRRPDLLLLLRADRDLQRPEVLLQPIDVGRAGDLPHRRLSATDDNDVVSRSRNRIQRGICTAAAAVVETYREDVLALRQEPGERQLAGRDALLLRQLGDAVDEDEVLGEVLLGEAGSLEVGKKSQSFRSVGDSYLMCETYVSAEVALLEVLRAADLAAEHAAADGRVGDDGGAELPRGLQQLDLGALDVEGERPIVVINLLAL